MSIHDQLNDEIAKILAQPPGKGSYKINALDANTDSCSLATGLASNKLQSQYIKFFNRPLPAWATLEHPLHIAHLCDIAIQRQIELPEQRAMTPEEEALEELQGKKALRNRFDRFNAR